MTKPLWLLDIDGVLNATGGSAVYRQKWPDANWFETSFVVSLEEPWTFGEGGPVRLKVAEPVRDFICEVHEAGLVEINWHTTWQDEAQKLANWLDLPTFPVFKAPEYFDGARGAWWKLRAIRRFVREEPPRPLLWTDDDIRFELRGDDDLALDSKNLIICPDDRFGLSPTQLTRIRTYLEEINNG